MSARTFFASLAFLVCLSIANGQTPAPIVVQAAGPASPTGAAAVNKSATENAGSVAAVTKLLREMKAVNEETLKKQAAALQRLEELEKAAEQIKVYTKRG